MHEIVTLQFGSRANYLGTHFWNTQESYFTYNPSDTPSIVDHDITFRPGVGSDGSDTYTPRSLIYDLKSNFGSLKKINALYDATDQSEVRGLWDGTQTIQTTAPVIPSPYQVALETGLATPQLRSNDVRYWSDFNRIFFHPRSLVPLSSQSLTSQLFASDSFSAGTDFFHELDLEVGGLLDRDVRPFVEECDSLQGFQVFSSNDDAWGGFMASYIEEMREEFGKKAIWVWGLEDGQKIERAQQYNRLANTSYVLASLATTASAYVRLSTVPSKLAKSLSLEANSQWNTTALMCSAIESMTLPTRLRPGSDLGSNAGGSMAFYENILGGDSGRNLWTLQASIISSSSQDGDGEHVNNKVMMQAQMEQASQDIRMDQQRYHDAADRSSDSDEIQLSVFDIDFTPSLPSVQTALPSLRTASSRQQHHIFAQVESHRYSPATALQSSQQYSSMSHDERIRRLYSEETIVQNYHTPLLFPLLDSFPGNLFSASAEPSRTRSRKQKRTIRIDASLSTTSQTQTDVLTLRDLVVGRAGRSMGLIELDRREEMYDEFTRVAEMYKYGFEDDLSDDGETEE